MQQLTADQTKGLVSSGASSLLRIERRRSPAMAMKTVVMAALQRVRDVMACRGGRDVETELAGTARGRGGDGGRGVTVARLRLRSAREGESEGVQGVGAAPRR